jgi:predicted nuclease of predicted toxin-antitoxin system
VLILLDTNLPEQLAKRLAGAGHNAIHTSAILPLSATDIEIAAKANDIAAIVMTKDEDFVSLQRRGILEAPLILLQVGNMTTKRLWGILAPLLPSIEAALARGEKIVEVR